MIELTRGDILTCDAEALVNAVNCVGVAGKGLALQFRHAFPEGYEAYRKACHAGIVRPGRVHVSSTSRPCGPRFIVDFPTKRHWRDASRIEDVESGLRSLVDEVRRLGIRSIAVPALGCGLGGLDWQRVRPAIEVAFAKSPEVRVILFQPGDAVVAATRGPRADRR